MAQDPARVRACYDTVAVNYAARYTQELDRKPFDREQLERFAQEVGAGTVCDLGCGPGHIAAHLAGLGVDVFGLDLSSQQIEQARRLFPSVPYRTGSMLALELADESLDAAVAFYSIVHFTIEQVEAAAREIARVLVPGGRLLLTFHIGPELIQLEEFLDHPVAIDFIFFEIADVVARLEAAGLEDVRVQQRAPYPAVESQTQRAYLTARKPA